MIEKSTLFPLFNRPSQRFLILYEQNESGSGRVFYQDCSQFLQKICRAPPKEKFNQGTFSRITQSQPQRGDAFSLAISRRKTQGLWQDYGEKTQQQGPCFTQPFHRSIGHQKTAIRSTNTARRHRFSHPNPASIVFSLSTCAARTLHLRRYEAADARVPGLFSQRAWRHASQTFPTALHSMPAALYSRRPRERRITQPLVGICVYVF
ncbi:hypothetical protein APED_08095 [Acanthopleuribacter pedis]